MKNAFEIRITLVALVVLLSVAGLTRDSHAINGITNGTFDTDLSGWGHNVLTADGSRNLDNTVYGVAPGSFRYLTNTGRRQEFEAEDTTYIPITINSSDLVFLNFYWYKYSAVGDARRSEIVISLIAPNGSTTRELWSNTDQPNAGQVLQGNVTNLDVSGDFQENGNYWLLIYCRIQSANSSSAYTQFNIDDIVLDVQAAANNAPTVVDGATAVSVSPVNRYGSTTTVISTDFTDTDDPGVGAFNVIFKIREPNDVTELTLVNNQPNGGGGLTIINNGGGSYTASYTYNPDDAQTIGLYDLYFEVTDGTDNVIDDYADNLNELEIDETLPNNAPTVVAGATAVSVSPVNRYGSTTTVISTDFTDTDDPGVGAFNVIFKIREPNDVTELTLVNNQPNGGGGLTIINNGGGSYTASYTYNPDDAQTLGLYDLYFEVTDGTDNVIDDYADNLNELEIDETLPNNAPTVVPGATQVSVSPVNRYGSNTTVISTDFTDTDDPGVGAFNVTFKIREPNDVTELTLVNNQPNGGGGLTIINNGGGSYTASYTYNPDDAQTIGLYDLYFEVTDGTDNVIDDYADNLNELEINETLPNNAPTVVAGATQVSVSPVNRYGSNTTVISTDFTDTDDPGVGAFNVTFKIREPNDVTELTLVDNQPNGGGGLTIINNGGGSYTASFTYNPDDAQTIGLYDLYFEVTDGTDNVIDDYADNLNELEIDETLPNNAPQVTTGATQAGPSSVNRYGSNSTVISAQFTDADEPGVGAFNVTFKIREPNNVTELTLVDNQPNGGGGLTITDFGGGTYSASYTYDPSGAQPLGQYDLYFEVTDGTDNAIDLFTNNPDELQIDQQVAPQVAVGATAATISPVARSGANTTTLYADFTDIDEPGINAFQLTFKVRRPDNSTEDILISAASHGGGVTVVDNGGGSYTGQYVWDPINSQQLGLYDLYFEVFDGTDNAIDDYPNNSDELEVVQNPPGNAPQVTGGATQVSLSPVDRLGANTTTISTSFSDVDLPGVGAFNVTFKIREPNNSTELTLVNNQPNGSGGVVITDGGGGNYTASYVYNPDDAQTLGLYDLYFEVSDGTGNAIDDYPNNPDELEINEVIVNNAPQVTPGATQVSVSPVNRFSANTTTVSTSFSDADLPGIGAFNVTFKIREPNNSTELTLVNNQPNGSGGLVITDDGGGNYTASYVYNPDDAQTLGLYDLYFEVTDGTDNVIDDYPNNLDELEINEVLVNNAPQVTSGATQVSVSPVNRFGANTTVISTDFTDTDDPGSGAFNVTFKIREPNDVTELTLVDNQPHGGGGLTIINNGGGSYTANYTYNPDDAQTLGLYDLYFEVTDGTDNAIDAYTGNLNELEVNEVLANNAPQITGGATQVSVSPVDRNGAITTALSTAFTDTDDPGIGAFNVTFKIREPNNVTEVTLAINQPHGAAGVTITDHGGGSYTASYNYNPYDGQTLGFYDLYCEVTDGTDNAIDGYANNLDELEINEVLTNNAPQVAPGGTEVSISPINRLGGSATVLGVAFYDVDEPGVGAFTATFKIREPNNVTELILVNDLAHGAGGLTITASGGGWYTATYSYNPADGQTLGLYDLYFAVSDGVDNDIDDYTNNLDELEINEVIANNAPQIVAGVTGVSGSPINRFGLNNTVISADFSDSDQPGITAFRILFKIREPDNSTELVLVNNLPHGVSGLTITDNGGGSYTASYTYNPDDAQTLGNYDLYCWVTDGVDNTVDDYANNLDELELNEAFVNNPPEVTGGATRVSVSPANRSGTNTTLISATFSDRDNPGVGAFNVTFKIREPNNSTEVVLVNNLTDGAGGLTITDNTGSYTARYTYDPSGSQTLGLYDLYFEVTDGTDNVIDDYANNLDELEIVDVPANNPPVLAAGVTAVNPSSVDRFGGGTSQLSATFTDADVPGVSAFFVTFVVREPYDGAQLTIADVLQHGQGGLTITDGGGGSYTTQIDWNPPDNSVLGYYDLYCLVSDGTDQTEDDFAQNDNELLLTNGGENAPPVVPADNVFASPAGVERIGANPTTVSATFTDADSPAIGVFAVTFKLRLPDNSSELILADNLGHGAGGVSIIDQGGGIYTASISWDPPDAQTLGVYDIYFHVTDGAATSYDVYYNNLDELEIYDAISNSAPTLVAGNTVVLPTSITRFGSEYTMIQTVFSDIDVPGRGAFTVTIKVRDQSSTEYTLVNAAGHREQGLRIRHVTGNDYEASVLWDPPVGQVTGTYDLYFYVEDNDAAAATDGYTNNADELTITPTALAGDGNLLRRTNDANNCGGANSACHNIADHQSQDCMVCHTPHSTANIYLVRDTINTPNSGLKEVVFKTLGIGDPYNDPDPTPGDPTSGVMADSLDGVFTGVCEVCHRTTTHHTNDGIGEGGTQLAANHNDALDCTGCHPHTEGFAVSGGGESSGGASCTCHSSIFASMDSTATTIHRHILANTDADYTGNLSGVYLIKNCLTCHVDHDIFRPDLNPGFGQRGKNLRVDYGTTPILGDNTVLANSDYSSTGLGGLCLSCHSGPNCDGCHSLHLKAASFDHQFIPKSDYDAATSAHNYDVAATFSTDGSTFNRNCTKCHSDDLAKSYQSSTYKVSAHGSNYSKILDATGVSAPADPLEEGFCFKCHSTTSNPNAGANLDYFGVQSMSNQDALGIEAAFSRTYTHPTATYSGRHIMGETGTDLADGNRHAECEDCHNPHAAQQGTHDGSSNLVSNALKGTWGVEPTSWPTPATPSDNANVFTAPSGYTKLEPAVKEYQICLKCHSNYTTLPSGARNLAEEINPNYPSTHGIVQPGTNAYCNTNTMNEPWASSGITYCSDCHRSDISSDPEGPHGSNMEHLLVATVVSNNNVGTPLCYVCHKETEYWSDGTNFSRFPDHPASKGAHKRSQGCFGCHMWDYSSTAGLGVSTTDWSGGNPPAGIFVHGQNKKWVYNERDGTSGSGQPVDAFVNGYIEDMDYNNRRCWSATCKSHSDKGY